MIGKAAIAAQAVHGRRGSFGPVGPVLDSPAKQAARGKRAISDVRLSAGQDPRTVGRPTKSLGRESILGAR